MFELIEERLVLVYQRVAVERERRHAACTVEDVRDLERHALCVLDIDTCFIGGCSGRRHR